jgi:hypothetical protein
MAKTAKEILSDLGITDPKDSHITILNSAIKNASDEKKKTTENLSGTNGT